MVIATSAPVLVSLSQINLGVSFVEAVVYTKGISRVFMTCFFSVVVRGGRTKSFGSKLHPSQHGEM
jgi:hypothetical protein